MSSDKNQPWAIILAAGKGKRMGGEYAKVLLDVAGEPSLRWVVRACRAAGVAQCVLVVGFQGDTVREAMADEPDCVFVEQAEQLGTGHAAAMAEPAFAGEDRDTFVLMGDVPLIQPHSLTQLIETHREQDAAATLGTAVLDDPTGYGRIIRDAQGRFVEIVEEKDATPEQRAIREMNPGFYCFRSRDLFASLKQIDNTNQQGEYYLTDVPVILRKAGQTVALVEAVAGEDVTGINTPVQWDEVTTVMQSRLASETPS